MIAAVLFSVFSFFWRPWLGGLWRRWPALNHGKMPVAFAAVWALAWSVGIHALDAVLLCVAWWFFWRAFGHGPMLRYPLGYDAGDRLFKLIYILIPLTPGEQVTSGEDSGFKATARWWLYASIRYVGAAAVVAGVVWFVRAGLVDFSFIDRAGAIGLAVGAAVNPESHSFPLSIVVAGLLVAFGYWIAARAPEGSADWLVKVGGVSRAESADYWGVGDGGYVRDFDPNASPFAEHNQYPHHIAEAWAGLVFGFAFAVGVVA